MQSQEIYFNLNPVNFLIISGLLQNFIIAGILFFKSGEKPLANKLLSATIVGVNLHLTHLMLLDTNLDNLFPSLLWIPYSFLTAIGPLIFFYVRALTDSRFTVVNMDVRSFIPLIIEVLLQVIQIIYSSFNNQLYYNTPFYFYLTPLIYLWAAGSILYYLRLSLNIISKHEDWVLKNYSNLKEITLQWLRKLIVYYRLLWIIWVPFVTTFLVFFRFQLQFLVIVLILYALMLILTYLTFWIGLEGMRHGNLIFLVPKEGKIENKNYNKLSPGEIQGHVDRIIRLMNDDKIYLNENLTLREFAASLQTDPNLVSYILNNHLNSNFYDFINRYRIEEFKARLNDPAFRHLTLLGIAVESGFNSKTTFNRVFKQMTGLTPTEFQKTQK